MSTASAVVPIGYKQTEIGVIPEDWVIKTVSDISVVSRGRVINQKEISKQINPKYPVYSSQTTNYGIFGFLDTFDFEGEYVTWTTDGVNAGKTFHRNGRFNCTNVCGIIKLISNDDPYFISLVLGRQTPNHVSTQLANPKLMNDIMKKIHIPVPSNKIEQRRIANIILNSEITINFLENLISKKKDIKQGTMQELLTGKTRLPGFTDEWQMKVLGDVGKVRMCKRIFNHETNTSGGVPFYKIGTFGKAADAYISQDLYDSYRTKFAFPDFGSILISAAGTIGRTVIYRGEDAYFQDSNIIWIENSENLISNHFLYHLLKVVNYTTEGGTIQRLYNSIVLNTAFTCPPKLEQEAIAEILSDMDAEIAALEERLEKAKAIKQGMMQQLLTGKIRLVEPQTSQEVSA